MPAYSPPPGGEVRPHRNLRSLYLTYLLIAIWAGVLPWLIPLSLFFPPVYVLAFTVPILLLVIVLVWWTGAYYHSVIYRFSDGGIGWERGVWRRQAGTVPYSRITAVEIIQGPLSRLFGISMLKIRAEGDLASRC
ncbi:MAG: PH domain-containing protein [Methanomicrobiales archaeon]|nr:PH domain-containing protein [Methanomicrobiales archaeon]